MSLFHTVDVEYQGVWFSVEVDQILASTQLNSRLEPPEAGDFEIIRIAFASDGKMTRIDKQANGFRKSLFLKPEADLTLDQRQFEFLTLDDEFQQAVHKAVFG